MEFKTLKKDLLPLLQNLNSVIENKQTIPILSHIYLKLENHILTLIGTDSEIEINLLLTVEEISPGETTISAQKLFDICKSLSEESTIVIKTEDNNKVFIKSDKSKFNLASLPADSFPKTEITEIKNEVEINQQTLLELLNDVAFSMAIQDVRYYLKGVFLEVTNEAINLVAIDGHRLAFSSNENTFNVEENISMIIPRKSVLEINKMLNETEAVVVLKTTETQLLLEFDNSKVVVRLIDGRYPVYQKLIPKNGDKELIINKELFKTSLQKTSILSNETYRGIRMTFNKDRLNISANNANQEQAEDEIEIDYQYPELNIGMNVNYVLDAINAIKNDKVKITVKGSSDHWVIQNPDKQYPLYVISPLKL